MPPQWGWLASILIQLSITSVHTTTAPLPNPCQLCCASATLLALCDAFALLLPFSQLWPMPMSEPSLGAAQQARWNSRKLDLQLPTASVRREKSACEGEICVCLCVSMPEARSGEDNGTFPPTKTFPCDRICTQRSVTCLQGAPCPRQSAAPLCRVLLSTQAKASVYGYNYPKAQSLQCQGGRGPCARTQGQPCTRVGESISILYLYIYRKHRNI